MCRSDTARSRDDCVTGSRERGAPLYAGCHVGRHFRHLQLLALCSGSVHLPPPSYGPNADRRYCHKGVVHEAIRGALIQNEHRLVSHRNKPLAVKCHALLSNTDMLTHAWMDTRPARVHTTSSRRSAGVRPRLFLAEICFRLALAKVCVHAA